MCSIKSLFVVVLIVSFMARGEINSMKSHKHQYKMWMFENWHCCGWKNYIYICMCGSGKLYICFVVEHEEGGVKKRANKIVGNPWFMNNTEIISFKIKIIACVIQCFSYFQDTVPYIAKLLTFFLNWLESVTFTV